MLNGLPASFWLKSSGVGGGIKKLRSTSSKPIWDKCWKIQGSSKRRGNKDEQLRDNGGGGLIMPSMIFWQICEGTLERPLSLCLTFIWTISLASFLASPLKINTVSKSTIQDMSGMLTWASARETRTGLRWSAFNQVMRMVLSQGLGMKLKEKKCSSQYLKRRNVCTWMVVCTLLMLSDH